ncbi:MAG: autotransporter domain-containing protein [Xanthobacteraceae bacterium]|nr:autotransporter domain-containing protein [Xanthobacteraceae bacterium]
MTGVSLATGGGGGDGYGGAIFVNNGGSLTITGNSTFAGNTAIGGASLNGGLAGGAAGTDLFLMTGATVNIAPGAGNVVTFNGTIADNSSASIGTPTTALYANYPASAGASLTVYSGLTVFNGQNTYSGQTVINGGALGGPLNPGTNTSGAPNYALTDGALQANDGVGLPTASSLNFSGPGQYTGGVLQVSNGKFSRYVSTSPNPDGGINPGSVEWTGSGGFAAINRALTVTLDANAPLTWGAGGFVPYGSSLIFGSANSNQMVTFTNSFSTDGTIAAGTAASILVANNGIAAGSVATISGAITGSGDLSIGGGGFNGTLILSGANSYTGATVVNSGTLALSGSGSIASSSSLTLSNVGTLDISMTTSGATIPTLTGSGNVLLGNQELTVANGGSFSGVLADGGVGGGTGGSLIIAGGIETLTGTNTYTGDTTINSGATLALAGSGSIANSKPVVVNGTFDISQTTYGASITSLQGANTGQVLIGQNLLVITNASTTFAGDINDGGIAGGTGGNLLISGGVQTLSGINTYTGVTIIAPGATLALLGSGSIASSSGVDALGTFDISQETAGATIATLMGNGNVALGNQKLTIAAGSTTFGGTIADGGIGGGVGGQLEISGGVQTLTGVNSYTGATTIDPGATLALSGIGSIANSADVVVNGTFDISQTSAGAAIVTLSGASTGRVDLGSQLLLITSGSTTFAGVISDGGIGGGAGGMLAIGGGTQTLTGINTYTGGTLVGSGATLALKGAGSIATSSFVDALGTFDISQTTAGASITTLLGTGTVALGAQELTITSGASTFAGVLADGGIGGGTGGSLIVSGGIQTLSGTNTYTGDTTIAPNPTSGTATLALAGTGSIATSSVVAIATGGTFDISQTAAGASITTLADSGTTPSGHVALGSQTLTITNGSTTFSGVIADGGIGGGTGGNLTVTGGTQTLAGVNTYTGVTTISPASTSATLKLVGAGSIAQSSEVVVATGGTFDISGTTAGASITTLSGSGSTVLGSEILTITQGAAGPAGANPAGIFTGIISGLGGLAITGGHEELRGSNTYFGGTTISNGAVVSVNSSSSLGASSSLLTLNDGGVILDNSLTIPQPVKLVGAPPGVDFFNLNSFNLTLSGAIAGPGVLTAVNGGTLNLTGTVSGLGGLVLGPGTNLTASATANAGLATTPIVLVSSSGTPTNLFTGTVHVVGPLDVINGATPELIILPGDSLVGVGSVNVMTVVQGGGANAPGDGPGTIIHNFSVVDLPNATFNVDIDGPTPSTGCTNGAGCAGQYSSVIVTGGNTYTANGAIAPNLRNIGAPANNNYTPPATTNFTVVTAMGGVLGSFSSLAQPTAGLAFGTRFDALYVNALGITSSNAITYSQNAAGNPNTVELWVTPASYQNLSAFNTSLNRNQSQVAYALDALRGINDLNPSLSLPAGLKNNPQATWDFGQLFQQQPQNLPGVFKTLNGEVATDLRQAAVQMTSEFLELMLDPAVTDRSGGLGGTPVAFTDEELSQPTAAGQPQSADGQPSPDSQQLANAKLAYASAMREQKAATFDQRWTAWASAFGGAGNVSGDAIAGSTDVKLTTHGLGGGMDYHFGDSVVGFALGGGSSGWNLSQSLGSGRSDVFLAGVYGATRFGPAYLAGALSFANHWASTDRFALGGDHLTSSFNAQSYGARVEAGYRIDNSIVAVTPYVAGEFQRFDTPNFSETDVSGGGFALAFASATATEIRGELGARFDKTVSIGEGMSLTLRGRAAYAYDVISDPGLLATYEAALAPGALSGANVGFGVSGAPLPKGVVIGAAGTELRIGNNWALISRFNGQFASGAQIYSGSGTLRYSW